MEQQFNEQIIEFLKAEFETFKYAFKSLLPTRDTIKC